MEDERVTLRVNNPKDLMIARPSSQNLFMRLLEKVRRGETVAISLSNEDWKRRRSANASRLEREDSDAGVNTDL